MKKLTLEERIERLEDRIFDHVCWMCHRELDMDDNHGTCERCRHGDLEDDEESV